MAPNIDRHGWIATEKVKTRFGTFEFKNGYPSAVAADALLEQLKFNRAIEVFLTQMPAVSVFAEHRGLEEFGVKRCNQIVIWESLMDAETILLTREHRDGLRAGPPAAEERRTDRRRGAAEDAGLRDGCLAALSGGHRAARAGQRPGRQVPLSSAGATPARCRRGTSSPSRRPTTSASVFGASRWMARPTRPSR